jgi:hypothetical protein
LVWLYSERSLVRQVNEVGYTAIVQLLQIDPVVKQVAILDERVLTACVDQVGHNESISEGAQCQTLAERQRYRGLIVWQGGLKICDCFLRDAHVRSSF